jgi:orotidine-5'-phosphate decarboxylase
MTGSELIVALDNPDLDTNERIAQRLSGSVAAFKVGLTLFSNHGPESLKRIGEHGRVFFDAKLHDIPEQVRGATRAIAGYGVWMVTVHALGGRKMIEAAVSEAGETIVAGVTVLTSLNGQDVGARAETLALTAKEAGARAVVCSGLEARNIRRAVGSDLFIVVPGVRPLGSDSHDQARVVTPADAAAAGADYLVVGRPITEAADPVEATAAINEQMASVT